MFGPLYLRLLVFAVCGVGLTAPDAACGWVCIKNESKAVLVVQEVPARPSHKRGKTVKLFPGEVYREHQTAAGERQVQVFDARDPARPLCKAKLKWPAKGDVTYKLELVEQKVRLTPVGPAKPTR
ncbi:MAG TPA: hypothetical protein VFG68_16815 [Fimbriiglobus sp.]|nr:hypothetical protein [Fimbriiglobus sp.]